MNELYHYGVKGMKWGVRKSKKQLRRERAKKNANSQVSKDYKEYRVSSAPQSQEPVECRAEEGHQPHAA